MARQLLAASLEREGKHDEAVVEYLKTIPQSTGGVEMATVLSEAYSEAGMPGFWRKFADFAAALAEQRTITTVFAASIYASIEEKDRAFYWLETAFEERSSALSHIKADPRYEILHSDSRFSELLQRMGLNQQPQ